MADEEFDIVKQIDTYLEGKASEPKERDYFYVSEVGSSKKSIYQSFKNRTKKAVDGRGRRIFDNGDYMHHRYYKYFAEMGILIAAELKAVENDLFHGYLDCLISDGKKLWVVDLKSCSMWTFNKLQEPDRGHKLQIMFYMYYMNIEQGMLIYENKDNQTIKVFKIQLDRALIEKYIEEFKKLKEDIKNSVEPADEPIKLEDLQYDV